MRPAILSLLPLLVVACAVAPPKEVPIDQQVHYWRVDRSTLSADVPVEDGCFRVQVTIGADGRVSDPKVLAVVGQKLAAWLPGFLTQLRFDPAPENPGRVPIRTLLTWTLHQTVTVSSIAAGSATALHAVMAAPPPPAQDDGTWNKQCQSEMDRQMGNTPQV